MVKLGPICRTTVLRPAAPRPAPGVVPNAPAAGPQQQQQQQQQAQLPNAGGIAK